MFDVSWSELLILGLVTLIFVGPKELPRFLNTLGRYLGVIRRHANEFRAVFDQAMREAEMEDIKKEVRAVSDGVKASLDEATRSVESVKQATRLEGSVTAKPALADKTAETTAETEPPPADAAAAPAEGETASADRPAKPAAESAPAPQSPGSV